MNERRIAEIDLTFDGPARGRLYDYLTDWTRANLHDLCRPRSGGTTQLLKPEHVKITVEVTVPKGKDGTS